ncbi:hypothetical protein KZP23_10350 [Echinicola marina]|uniref:hypothetical protein n=1 Tax=Echinicola marina TaxID=2859768 RepID=UPI001CF6EF88|nr:hypothetical protein [Echinicola marina]UCS95375.1 hypothetical protein KZP23_10350 [Echinicola marina]
MKKVMLTLVLFFEIVITALSQEKAIITLNGIPLSATKSAIQKQFGVPINTVRPDYECGFLSSDEQGEVFYSMEYDGFKWTGNEKSSYVLDELKMEKADSLKLVFQGQIIDQNTTSTTFLALAEDLETSVDEGDVGANTWSID